MATGEEKGHPLADFDEYQALARESRLEEASNIFYLTLGLNDEAGEVAGAVKKCLRGDYGEEEMKSRLFGELGDVLWYLSQVADIVGLDLGGIAQYNIDKLTKRADGGTLRGDGEDR